MHACRSPTAAHMTDSSSMTDFMAVPEVQRDIVEGNASWRITLLKLLAWKVLTPHDADTRKQMVRQWLPYVHHRNTTGLVQLAADMNSTAQPSLLPPFMAGPPLCALWHATTSWDGKSVTELLQLGQAVVQASDVSAAASQEQA